MTWTYPQITPGWRLACMLSSQGPLTQNNIRLVHRDARPELRATDPSAGRDTQLFSCFPGKKAPSPLWLPSERPGALFPRYSQRTQTIQNWEEQKQGLYFPSVCDLHAAGFSNGCERHRDRSSWALGLCSPGTCRSRCLNRPVCRKQPQRSHQQQIICLGIFLNRKCSSSPFSLMTF